MNNKEYLELNSVPLIAKVTMKNVVVKMEQSAGTPGALFGFTDKSDTNPCALTVENCYYITTTGYGPLGKRTGNYVSMTDGGDETLFGTKTSTTVDETTKMTVTTYANGLTGYTAADLDTAKAAFADAVTENSDMISDTLKELLAKANA